MPPPPRHPISPLASRPAAEYGWLSDAFGAAFDVFNDPQLAAAATLLGAAERIIFTGSGPGLDAAACGATAFAESGFEALSCHAGDLTQGSLAFQPGDLVVGIDSDSAAVAGAMRRARNAGLHTVGITTRDLTIIDADVLLYLPAEPVRHGLAPASVLACCLTIALIAARLEPETALATEVARIERYAHRVTSASGRLMASILFSPRGDQRIIFAGKGSANWAARSIAQQLNRTAGRHSAPFTVHADLHDIEEGFWSLDPADLLVAIDPYDHPPARQRPAASADSATAPQRTWSFTRRAPKSPQIIHLPGQSPALGALLAYTALTALIEFAGNSTVPST